MKVLDSTAITTDNRQSVRGPKLPAFDDANDNIDAYIQRFERYATSQKWNRDNWGLTLVHFSKARLWMCSLDFHRKMRWTSMN